MTTRYQDVVKAPYLLKRYQELIGEYKNHRDGGLSISPTAAEVFKTRVVDTGEEAKYQDVIQQVNMGAYEQPCQLFNITMRLGIFWGWNQVSFSTSSIV